MGGDVNFIKTTGDLRHYAEVTSDVIGMSSGVRAGYATAWGNQQLRMLDHFQGGP